MTQIRFAGRRLGIDSVEVELPFVILEAFTLGERVIVLGDPEAMYHDPERKQRRGQGLPSRKNLIALAIDGTLLWEAEFPDDVDYYYKITNREPLTAYSFSGFACRIDPATGRIVEREFFK